MREAGNDSDGASHTVSRQQYVRSSRLGQMFVLSEQSSHKGAVARTAGEQDGRGFTRTAIYVLRAQEYFDDPVQPAQSEVPTPCTPLFNMGASMCVPIGRTRPLHPQPPSLWRKLFTCITRTGSGNPI